MTRADLTEKLLDLKREKGRRTPEIRFRAAAARLTSTLTLARGARSYTNAVSHRRQSCRRVQMRERG